MCFLVCQRGKGREVNNKTSSQSQSPLRNRLSPKPHPKVQEHTSSQSRTQRQAPASTHRPNTDFTFNVSGGMKNLTAWWSNTSSKSSALCSHQRTQLSWDTWGPDLHMSLQNCHLIHPHLNCKLQTSQISHRRQPQPAPPSLGSGQSQTLPLPSYSALQNLCRQRMPISQMCVHYFQIQELMLLQKKKTG